jgi:hypothetical protein
MVDKKQKPLKISDAEKIRFPYNQFPVKIIHRDGKDLSEIKTCYFQNEHYAKKYILRSKFSKKDYEIFIKPEDK